MGGEPMTSRIDESRPFVPLRIAVMTVSDTRTAADDRSGDLLVARLTAAGHDLADRRIVPDEQALLSRQVQDWADSGRVDAVLTTGGTGLTGRDVTVEAISPLFSKTLEGFAVVFHMVSYDSVGLSTLQSRACAGIVPATDGSRAIFVFCLPGSTGACKDGWDKVIAPQLDSRHRPCNLHEIMPRLTER